jgi:hypothetical protein
VNPDRKTSPLNNVCFVRDYNHDFSTAVSGRFSSGCARHLGFNVNKHCTSLQVQQEWKQGATRNFKMRHLRFCIPHLWLYLFDANSDRLLRKYDTAWDMHQLPLLEVNMRAIVYVPHYLLCYEPFFNMIIFKI